MRIARVLLLALSALLLPLSPARAGTAMSGGVTFEGVVDFATGSWAGTATGSLSGRHIDTDGDEVPWSLIMVAPATADFEYTDPVGLGPCIAGVAHGELRITGKVAEVAEVWGAYAKGGPLPRSIVGLQLTAAFEWRWAGTTGALVLSDLVVQVEVYGFGLVTVAEGTETVSVGAAPTTHDCADGSFDAALTGLAAR